MTDERGLIDTTLGQLAEAEAAIGRLASARMPFAAAYRVSKLAKAVALELTHFHECRTALVREYGEPRDSTPAERAAGAEAAVIQVSPASASWPTFVVKARELADVPVTLNVPAFDPSSVPGLEITAGDLVALGPLVMLPDL